VSHYTKVVENAEVNALFDEVQQLLLLYFNAKNVQFNVPWSLFQYKHL